MTFTSLKKGLCAVLSVLALTAAPAAAMPSPEAQIDTIAGAQEVWKYEFPALCAPDEIPFHLRSFTPATTLIAVTDLDGNGRLELLFRHVDYLKWKVGSVPYAFHQIPTAVAMAVYEVGADGRLARLPVTEDGCGAPDLIGLDVSHPILEDGVRWYPVRTQQIYKVKYGYFYYIIAHQRVAIKDGRVMLKMLADEHGYYNIYDVDRFEEVATSINIYDGNPAHKEMLPADFRQTAFYQEFDRSYTPRGTVHWISGSELNSNPHKALLSSYQGFVSGVMDGMG